jgi:hypothetical protein
MPIAGVNEVVPDVEQREFRPVGKRIAQRPDVDCPPGGRCIRSASVNDGCYGHGPSPFASGIDKGVI